MNFFVEQILTPDFENVWFPKDTGWGMGVWDGNAVKFGCDDCCTTINVIKFINLKKYLLKK